MRCEWPDCKRCCFCIPLRYGLLVWAYIKLILLIFAFLSYMVVSRTISALDWAFISFYIVDFCVQLAFIVGAHMKNYKIIRFYYYYGLVGLSICVIGFCVLTGFIIYVMVEQELPAHVSVALLELLIGQLLFIALNVYLLILVRSEMVKLRDNHQFRFVNNAAEADCTVTMDYARQDTEDPTGATDQLTLVIEDRNGVEKDQQS